MWFKADYFLVWQQSPEIKEKSTTEFRAPFTFDFAQVNQLRNLLHDSRFWPVDATRAFTLNPIRETLTQGQWTDPSKFVCGYFVIRGNPEATLAKSNEIDRSYAAPFIGRLSPEAMDDLEAHATATFAPVSGIDATIIVFWANNYSGPPRMPSDLVMGAINAYNKWGRQLAQEGALLDAGRMNVRHGATHLINGEVREGPFGGGRLLALGSYAPEGPPPFPAINESGLLSGIPGGVISARKCNGWCLALANAPAPLDDPRYGIFV